MHTDKKDGGYIEDDPEWGNVQRRICMSPEHQPPMHIYIPPGKRYVHVCPGCGRRVIVRGIGAMFCAA